MTSNALGRVGILWRGDRSPASPRHDRLTPMFDALTAVGVSAEPVVFDDEWVDDVRTQLLALAGVLVWVDPVMGERTRAVLDDLLRAVALRGTWVSTHPDVIERLGTKEILVATRDLPCGSDVHIYRTLADFCAGFPDRLASAGPRVLKPYRGNAGIGVLKASVSSDADATVEIQDAHPRGTDVEPMSLAAFLERCEAYFAGGGGLIDQPFQPRITDGMVRCYLVRDHIVGFAFQQPDPAQRASGRVFGLPSGKTMLPPHEPRYAGLRASMESSWIREITALGGVAADDLPMLWDADFMFGPKDARGADTYVLCEINVSCITPFPPEAPVAVAAAVAQRLRLSNSL